MSSAVDSRQQAAVNNERIHLSEELRVFYIKNSQLLILRNEVTKDLFKLLLLPAVC